MHKRNSVIIEEDYNHASVSTGLKKGPPSMHDSKEYPTRPPKLSSSIEDEEQWSRPFKVQQANFEEREEG